MLIRQILMAIIGLSSGFTVAGGIFAFIVGLGIIPRFAGRTHTAHRILWYEDCVLAGGALGNLMYIYQLPVHLGKIGLGFYGLFGGMFVGAWAMALAEIVNTIPIFERRIKLREGLTAMIISMAIGRSLGAILYFFQGG